MLKQPSHDQYGIHTKIFATIMQANAMEELILLFTILWIRQIEHHLFDVATCLTYIYKKRIEIGFENDMSVSRIES